jgi:hypothetical protein
VASCENAYYGDCPKIKKTLFCAFAFVAIILMQFPNNFFCFSFVPKTPNKKCQLF